MHTLLKEQDWFTNNEYTGYPLLNGNHPTADEGSRGTPI